MRTEPEPSTPFDAFIRGLGNWAQQVRRSLGIRYVPEQRRQRVYLPSPRRRLEKLAIKQVRRVH